MHLYHSICLLFLLSVNISTMFAQRSLVDSLETLLIEKEEKSQRLPVLIDLAQYMEFQNPAKGILYATEAYEIANQIKDTLAMADAQMRMGACYINQGNLDKAEFLFRDALVLERVLKDPVRIGRQYVNLANLHDSRGDMDSSIIYNEKALQNYWQVGNALDSAIVFNNLGIVFERLAQYPRSIEAYLKASNGFEKAGREDYMSAMYVNIGNTYLLQEEFPEALTYFRKSLHLKKKVHDKFGESIVYNSLGNFFMRTGEQDSSIYFNKASLALRESIQDTIGMVSSFINLGNNYSILGETETARSYQEKAYDLSKKKRIKSELARSGVELGQTYMNLGQDKEAEKYLVEALALAEQGGEPETQLRVYKTLSSLFKKTKDTRAFELYEKYIVLDDSLRNDEQTREITRLGMQHEFDKEKEFLALQQQKKELAFNAELDRQIFQRNIGLGALGSGLIILGLLWRSYRVKQRNNRLLEAQKNSLEIALEDRENLLKEIHHRVKNNLQVVSSLLSLQSRSTDDPVALGALEEGRNRVKAMGLIHQNLYQEDNLVGVNLAQYLEKLTNSLLDSYKVDSGKIHITRKIDAVSLDVDTLIPLGLILNELISNSLKYAFPERQEGNIKLAIARDAKGLLVQVEDDGIGMPENFNPEASSSMGYKLIRAFVKKMKASMEINTQSGTLVSILLPENSWIAEKAFKPQSA